MFDLSTGWKAGLIASALLILAACGGGGGGDSTPPPVASKVFAADEVNGGVGSTENSNPTPGTLVQITRIIAGSNTQIPVGPGCFGCLPSLALDSARDQLYVSTNNNILVFNNAGTASGNIAPSRTVGGAGTGVRRRLQLNTASDVLYVSTTTGSIFRIDGASGANSATTASRTLTLNVGPGDTLNDIALDATNDVLYVAFDRGGVGTVGIIGNVSTRVSGAVTPDAEITIGSGSILTPAITVDGPRDRLYVANESGRILVFDGARARTTGTPTADRTILLPFVMQHRVFIETTNDRLYASAQNRVVIVNNAGTANGAVANAVAQLSTFNSDITAIVARP
jgi:hypothetical protein